MAHLDPLTEGFGGSEKKRGHHMRGVRSGGMHIQQMQTGAHSLQRMPSGVRGKLQEPDRAGGCEVDGG